MNLQNFIHATRQCFSKTAATRRVAFSILQTAAIATALLTFTPPARAEWSIDLSRRQSTVRERDLNDFNEPNFERTDSTNARSNESDEASVEEGAGRSPASARALSDNDGAALDPVDTQPRKIQVQDSTSSPLTKVLKKLVQVSEPGQEIVILQTEKGFVPDTVRMKKDARYTVHVVNVNEKEKNVSFILDAFSEHHATYFGKVRTFTLEPKKDGIFSFQSPETAAEGRLIVYTQQLEVREPAAVKAAAH